MRRAAEKFLIPGVERLELDRVGDSQPFILP
jgi:hypothetical protein